MTQSNRCAGNEAPAGLGDRLLWGWWGRGHGNTDQTLDPKTEVHPEELRWAPSPSAALPPSAAGCLFCLAGGSSAGLVLNSGHQILFPLLGHLPCPLSLFLAPSSYGRSKNRLSSVAFQVGMNKKPQPQRSEAEKGKETTSRRASKPTQS